MSEERKIDSLAETLRREFDAEFSRAPHGAPPPEEQLLAVEIDGRPFALRSGEIQALLTRERLTLLPGTAPGFLGLLGYHGDVLPVYSLRELLGFSRSSSMRWFAIVGRASPVAFAFDTYEGTRSIRAGELLPSDENERETLVRYLVNDSGKPRAIVDLTALLKGIESRCEKAISGTKE